MSEIIYHYTDGHGLLGLITTGKIFCTQSSYLNDALESNYSRTAYRNTLDAIANDQSIPELDRKFAQTAIFRLDSGVASLSSPFWNPIKHWVACFSGRDDDLALWRGYAGTGPRFCVGFLRSELDRLDEIAGMRLAKVNYNAVEAAIGMREMFFDQVEKFKDRLAPKGSYTDPMQLHPPEFNYLNSRIVDSSSPLLKHFGFASEDEWRLYSDPQKGDKFQFAEIKFRVGRSMLLPYIEVDLASLSGPIHSILIGPTPHPAESLNSVHYLLGRAKSGLINRGSDVVRKTKIPYRDW